MLTKRSLYEFGREECTWPLEGSRCGNCRHAETLGVNRHDDVAWSDDGMPWDPSIPGDQAKGLF